MKLNNSLELRIRIKIALLFLIVILYFAGVYFYSGNLKKSIDLQKEDMSDFYDVLSQSEHLIITVQEAQNALNEYLVTSSLSDMQQFDSISAELSNQLVNLKQITPQKEEKIYLDDIDSLLSEKKVIVSTLIQKLRQRNPIKKIDKKIETYQEIVKDSVIITTFKDTTVVIKEKSEKKNIWSRLKNLVKPVQSQDSIIQISEVEQQTKLTSRVDTGISSDLISAAKEASITYTTQITGIEKQVRELILAEQNISLQISKLLTKFYNETTLITQNGIRESEMLTQRIFDFAILIGALSLFIMLVIILLIASDLNKGRKARLDLATEKQLTESLMNSRHKLLLSVSHDIKTPLSSIMGYLEMWTGENNPGNKNRQLKSAQNSAQHILSMLTNLLEFSRLEQKNAELHVSRFNVIELMEDIIKMFQPLTDEKELVIESDFQLDNPFWIETDLTVLKQILCNIVSNAAKYTPQGKVSIRLFYDNQLTFIVSDTGIGMSENEIRDIYKPFSRYQSNLATEGSGFGMYVTKGLIQSLHGEIKIVSEKDKGTEVTVRLPLHPIAPDKSPDLASESEVATEAMENLLIFEDDLSLGKMIGEFLSQRGLRVEICNSPKEVEVCIGRASMFDVIFTDMDMIGFNGNEILHKIRQSGSNIPVWLMTANGDYTNQKALLEGFSGLIEKPIQLQRISKIIFGKHESLEAPASETGIFGKFPSLTAMVGNDEESIKSILSTFVESAHSDTDMLTQCIESSSFKEAQQLCHKMHPFITQIGAEHLCGVLKKMDAMRGQDSSAFPEWKKELAKSVVAIRDYADEIKKENLSEKKPSQD